jgi:hypothetical protein
MIQTGIAHGLVYIHRHASNRVPRTRLIAKKKTILHAGTAW